MRYLSDESGQGLTEYSLLLILVAIFLMILLTFLSSQIIATYERIIAELAVI